MTDHELDQVKEELENKIEALKDECEKKQLTLEVEMNYWQYSILNLFKQLVSNTTGIGFILWTYICIVMNSYIQTHARISVMYIHVCLSYNRG